MQIMQIQTYQNQRKNCFFFYIFLQKLKQNNFKKNKKVFRQAKNSTNAITKEKKEKKTFFSQVLICLNLHYLHDFQVFLRNFIRKTLQLCLISLFELKKISF